MPEVYVLLFAAAAIYLFDCARWWRCDVVVFRAAAGERFRTALPGAQLGNESGGFVWGNPFPPLGTMVGAAPWPVAVSPDGVYGYSAQVLQRAGHVPSTKLYVPWEAVPRLMRQDRKLLVDDETLVELPTARAAHWWHAQLLELAATDDLRRAAAVERFLHATLDEKNVDQRADLMGDATRGLRWLCNLLLLYIIAAIVVLVGDETATVHWPWWLGGLLVLNLTIALVYAMAHRRLYGAESGRSPWSQAALMCVSPLTAVRAVDGLTADAMIEFHPAAVARRLLDPAGFQRFLRHVLLDLSYPLAERTDGLEPPADSVAVVEWCRDRQWRELTAVVERLGLRVDAVLAPPQRDSHEVRSYCPRCREQYVADDGDCPACSGVARASF